MADLETLDTDGLSFQEQASNPATPAATDWRVFFKSGGLYVIEDTGTVYGPLQNSDRQLELTLTNRSGGSVAAGDVVVVDTANDESFTTTTTGRAEVSLGVAQETIANAAAGRVLVAGYAALVNVPAAVTRGHYVETHTVAKQATGNSARRSGSFGQFLTGGTTPKAWLWGQTDQTATGGSLTVQDEGTPLTTAADTLNFTGAGVTASGTTGTKTINIPGGGGDHPLTDMDTAPASPNAKNEEFTGAMTGATWIANTGTPTSSSTRSDFAPFDGSTGVDITNPLYSINGIFPGMLAMRAKNGARLLVYKAFAPAAASAWAMGAKVRLVGASGIEDRIMVGVSAAVPTLTSTEPANSLQAELRASTTMDYTLGAIVPASRPAASGAAHQPFAYLALTGHTDGKIRVWYSLDGLGWSFIYTLAETTSPGGTGGVVQYAYLYHNDYHSSGEPSVALVEWWRFLEGSNDLWALGGGR